METGVAWLPDSASNSCMACDAVFSLMRLGLVAGKVLGCGPDPFKKINPKGVP